MTSNAANQLESTTTMFLVVLGNSWGTGKSIAEAKIAKKEGGRGKRLMTLRYDGAVTTVRIDELGRILFTGPAPTEVK